MSSLKVYVVTGSYNGNVSHYFGIFESPQIIVDLWKRLFENAPKAIDLTRTKYIFRVHRLALNQVLWFDSEPTLSFDNSNGESLYDLLIWQEKQQNLH